MTPTDDITFILGRLEGKVDSLLTASRQQGAVLTEHDGRIRKLENYKSYVLGWTVAIASLTSLVTYFIGS